MSVLSYVRLPCPLEEAMARYGRWIGLPEVAPRRLVRERDAIDLALADGARWVEEDELELTRPEEGWLWIHRAP
jgi:hypothetical protein